MTNHHQQELSPSLTARRPSPEAYNRTFLQPFISYTTKDAWTFTLDTESTYDWLAHEWSVPINFEIAKLVKFGTQPVQFQAGVRYWAENPDTGAHDFGARFNVIFLFPTGKKG